MLLAFPLPKGIRVSGSPEFGCVLSDGVNSLGASKCFISLLHSLPCTSSCDGHVPGSEMSVALRMVFFSCSAFPVYIAAVTYCCTALLLPSAGCGVLERLPTP